MNAAQFVIYFAGLTLAVVAQDVAGQQPLRTGVVPALAPRPLPPVIPQRFPAVLPPRLNPYQGQYGAGYYSHDHFYNRSPEGAFQSGYTSPDGTQVFMQGELVPTSDGQDLVVIKRGGYSYISPEGQTISVRYIADHLGFRVVQDEPVRPRV